MELEVGTLKTNIETESKTKRRLNTQTGRGLGNNGRKGDGGGGDNGDGGGGGGDHYYFDETGENKPNKYRIGMWFTLLIVLMTFSGLIGAYVVIATNGVLEWKPFNLPVQVWISTALLFFSSVSYEISRIKLKNGNQKQAKTLLLVTTILGATFISSQILAWLELYSQGIYLQSNPYAGFFYFLTAIHALHVFGGICALGYIVLRTWHETSSENELEKRQTIATVVGWYWHFMDGLWIVLLLLLGFFK